MKRILTLVLVLALALAALTSCAVVDTVKGWFEKDCEHSFVNGECEKCGEADPDYVAPVVDEDLQAAYDYIKENYKKLGITTTNFEVMKAAPIGEKVFAITWTASNEAITITESEDGNFYVVNVPELGEEAINYTLNFSIQNEAGEKKEGSFNLTVPAFAVNTYEEYVEAEDGTALVIRGIVTGIYSKSTNSTKENSLLIQDLEGKGGYYAYQLEDDPAGVISVGMTVEVRGNKKTYNGTFELTDPVVTVIDPEIKTVTPIDITETVIAASGLDATELVKKNGALVTIKGVTLLDHNSSNGYHNFKIGNHTAYLRVSSSSNMITKAEGETVTETFKANFYYKADVTGIITLYNNAIYLMPVSSAPFANLVAQELPDDAKVDLAINNTTVPGMIQIAGDTALPTTTNIDGVAISWALVNGADCATLSGSTLTVTIPEEAKNVTLTATYTCGEATKTKDYTIVVKPISTITIEQANNIGMNMTHNTYTEELYYIVGTIDSIVGTDYGNMYIKDGDFSIYIYGLYDATGKIRYDAMDPQPLAKDTIKVLSSVGKYNNDVQLKNAKVIEHTIHPDNVVEQAPEIEFKPVNPIVDTEFFIGMTKNDTVYYITGYMGTGNSQYYMASTAKQADAAKVTVVAGPTEGTYYLTVVVDGATKYLDLVVSGTHKNAVYADAAPEVGLSFDADTKTFYKELDGANYTFGTALSNNYTTIGGVQVSADNAMLQISFAAEHTCTFTDVVTAPTCEDQGYTTHTCVCGNVVVDTYVDALDHDFGENNDATDCLRDGCDVLNPAIHTCTFQLTKTEAPTCTTEGYELWECTDEECELFEKRNVQPVLAHADTDGDYKCDNGTCDEIVLPAADSVLTIAEALKIGELYKNTTGASYAPNKYYIVGKITELTSTKFGTCKITDETGTIDIYGLKDSTGTDRYEYLDVKPVVGDTVKIYGSLGAFKQAVQFDNSNIIEHTVHTCVPGAEATCTTAQTCTLCSKVIVAALGHDYQGATCTVPGICSVCQDVGKTLPHTFEGGICSGCGASETDTPVVVPQYVKVNSATEFTSGTYVLVVNTSNVTFSTISGTWVVGDELTVTDGVIAKATGDTYAITLNVTDAGVTIKIGDQFVAPKSGNNNGIVFGTEYVWAYSVDDNGNITFKGTGSDTTTLAYNSTNTNPGPGFRAYKNTTAAGSNYHTAFSAYKLVE